MRADSLPVIPGYEALAFVGWGCSVPGARFFQGRRASDGSPVHITVSDACVSEPNPFAPEVGVLARLTHPNVAWMETGEVGGHWYRAAESLPRTLAERLREGPIPVVHAVTLARTLADVLQYARDRGLVQDDLAPGSILLTADGVPKLRSFRASEAVRGSLPAHLAFLPPELLAGMDWTPTPAKDVYAIGAVMYAMLTGRPPFEGRTPILDAYAVLHSPVPSPWTLNAAVPPGLEAVCLRCLDRLPERRYATLPLLTEALDTLLRTAEL